MWNCRHKKKIIFFAFIFPLLSGACKKEIDFSIEKNDALYAAEKTITGTYYYVSAEGNDSNPGTKEMPFKTIAYINKIKLKQGDRIYFKGGEIFEGTLSLFANGTSLNPIIITSYDSGTAMINGRDSNAIIIKGDHFRLRNLDAKGAGRKNGNTTDGIYVNGTNAIIENIDISGFQKSGLDLYNCASVHVNNISANDNGFCGIYVGGSSATKSKNITLQDCSAKNNPGDPTNLTNHSGNGILVWKSDSVLIDHCTATNNGWDMPYHGNGPVGIWAAESNHVTIQYCLSYKNKTSAGSSDGGGFDLDGGEKNSIIQYCLSYLNYGAGYGIFQYSGANKWANNTIRYCVSINDAQTTKNCSAFYIWNNTNDSLQFANCTVYNNVVYNSSEPAVRFDNLSKNKNFNFYNNIFMASGAIIAGPQSGDFFLGNVWWHTIGTISFRGYNTLSDWANATEQEKLNGQLKGMQIDPLLTGPFTTNITNAYLLDSLTGYTLKPNSTLKDKGLNLQTLFNIPFPSVDFFGNPTPQGLNPEPGIDELN